MTYKGMGRDFKHRAYQARNGSILSTMFNCIGVAIIGGFIGWLLFRAYVVGG